MNSWRGGPSNCALECLSVARSRRLRGSHGERRARRITQAGRDRLERVASENEPPTSAAPQRRPQRGEPQRGEPRGANLSEGEPQRGEPRGADLRGEPLERPRRTSAGRTSRGEPQPGGPHAERTSAGRTSRANLSGATSGRGPQRGEPQRGELARRLHRANLSGANLSGANLSGANLSGAILVDTDLTGADLTGCRIYGVSAWDLKLEGPSSRTWSSHVENEPEITVDNIEVAQFIYLMLHNQKIRDVIDTITSKAVLILGRFTDERKAVLDALREELRKRNYLPILFDFDVPATRDITETVSLLARMARFIIADLTDPSSIPKELEAIVPHLAVPVQPLLEGSSRPYAMFKDYWKYDWVLPVYRYEGLEPLLATLAEKVIAPAEGKVKALQERRRMIEAELTKPR